MSDKKKCKHILDVPGLMPGWGCCKCKTYNGIQRFECRYCDHIKCDKTPITFIETNDPKDKEYWN